MLRLYAIRLVLLATAVAGCAFPESQEPIAAAPGMSVDTAPYAGTWLLVDFAGTPYTDPAVMELSEAPAGGLEFVFSSMAVTETATVELTKVGTATLFSALFEESWLLGAAFLDPSACRLSLTSPDLFELADAVEAGLLCGTVEPYFDDDDPPLIEFCATGTELRTYFAANLHVFPTDGSDTLGFERAEGCGTPAAFGGGYIASPSESLMARSSGERASEGAVSGASGEGSHLLLDNAAVAVLSAVGLALVIGGASFGMWYLVRRSR
jgi:hypothetical protein